MASRLLALATLGCVRPLAAAFVAPPARSWKHPSTRAAALSPLASLPTSPRGVAIVTGGSGGIGFACASKLAAAGADVVLAYGHNATLAAEACANLTSSFGVRAFSVQGDLSSNEGREATVEAIFKLVDEELGGEVSYFVHAAGYFHDELLSHHFAGACSDFEVPTCPLAFISCNLSLPH